MTVGEFLLVMAYMAQLYEPLRTMSTKIPELQSSLASLHRAFALLEETPELDASPEATNTLRTRGEVEFRNVSFQYTAGGRNVLNDISFHIRPGMRVGVVGPSGSGKSTLVNLLTRFYDPTGRGDSDRWHGSARVRLGGAAATVLDRAAGADAVFDDGGGQHCLRRSTGFAGRGDSGLKTCQRA